MNYFYQSPRSKAKLTRILVCLGSAIAFALMAGTPALAEDASSAASAPSFQIESPTSATPVHSPVSVKILVHGATIGSPEDGLDHLHITVDQGDVVPVYKIPIEPLKLAPGQHTLEVQLAGPDHKPITAKQTVTFTVKP